MYDDVSLEEWERAARIWVNPAYEITAVYNKEEDCIMVDFYILSRPDRKGTGRITKKVLMSIVAELRLHKLQIGKEFDTMEEIIGAGDDRGKD